MRHALRLAIPTTLLLAFAGLLLPAAAQAQIRSWNKNLPGATRFTVLGALANEAALDRETGLVWQLVPESLQSNVVATHRQASLACLEATTGRKRGWRLPSAEELLSLSDPKGVRDPTLPSGHPFLVGKRLQFVTSSASADPRTGEPLTLFVDFRPVKHPIEPLNVEDEGSFWCVRGGSTHLN